MGCLVYLLEYLVQEVLLLVTAGQLSLLNKDTGQAPVHFNVVLILHSESL